MHPDHLQGYEEILRELDWLSASEGIFSVGVMGGGSVEAQLELSTARHVTPWRNPLTSLQGWR